MKSLKLKLVLLCIATFVTLGLSHEVAQAKCIDRMVGGNAYGDYDCTFTDYCGGWCYYSCTCSNVFPGYTCDDVLIEAGFTLEDNPQCFN